MGSICWHSVAGWHSNFQNSNSSKHHKQDINELTFRNVFKAAIVFKAERKLI